MERTHRFLIKLIVKLTGWATFLLVTLLFLTWPSFRIARAQGAVDLQLYWTSEDSGVFTDAAWGDYDGDGDLDLAVGEGGVGLGEEGGGPQLYRNDGGTLTPTPVWVSPENQMTLSVTWGDYDDDGDLDLAVGNYRQPNRVYCNNTTDGETPSFIPVWTSSEESDSNSVIWGDADNDGDLDLAVGNDDAPNRLYISNEGAGEPCGDLNLTSAWTSPETEATTTLAWGDVDGDGDLDLAEGNSGTETDDPGRRNRLYRNVYSDTGGSQWFTPVWTSTPANATNDVAWGDYDDDGDLDLVAGNYDAPTLIYANDGGILSATPVWTSSESESTTSVAWGDVNGDGALDLAESNPCELGLFDFICHPNRVYISAAGVLPVAGAEVSENTLATFVMVAWGDVDGDGALDLFIAKAGDQGLHNELYRNEGVLLTEAAQASFGAADSRTMNLAWGDVDGDDDLDLAVGHHNQPDHLYLNQAGNLSATPVWTTALTTETLSLAWGDVDGDGDLDLAAGVVGPNLIYRNEAGTLNPTPAWRSPEAAQTASLAWGDVDGDGDLDLAAGNVAPSPTESGANHLYRNETLPGGPPQFTLVWTATETADPTYSLAWGDYDGDGDLDLAAGNGFVSSGDVLTGFNRLYRNNGGRLTATAVWSSSENENTISVAWGDYDGDGDLDLAAGNTGQANRLYRNEGLDVAGRPDFAVVWTSLEEQEDLTNSLAWGDYDGDGDLDLAVGNGGLNVPQQNRLYRNDAGTLTPRAVWSSAEKRSTLDVAWGDINGDGDLDLAAGNFESANRIYHNLRRDSAPLIDNPPYPHLSRPGAVDDAYFFSTFQILAGAVPISYTLYDPEDDPVARLIPEYSPNGGGRWFPATPAEGQDLTNLAAGSTGVTHTFIWDAEKDLIKSDNVIFRLRAQPSHHFGPILWPAIGAKSPPFRVEAPWYIKVVDAGGNPLPGATVYADGRAITQTTTGASVTNAAGLLNPDPLSVETRLAALVPQFTTTTVRAAHDDWAYRVHLTNLTFDDAGKPQAFEVSEPGAQILEVNRTPLILLNLVVSIEWNATQVYIDEVKTAFQETSAYLYDLTDGQLALGRVAIYDEGQHWFDADIQISAKNIVRPYAYIGGLVSDDRSEVVRLGRAWNGYSGNQGPWDKPDGFRTIAHELGHYALHLYDEYFVYVFDDNGNLIRQTRAYCTDPDLDQTPDATNASAMYDQYRSSELSARDVAGLWSDLCEQTYHWQETERQTGRGESPWETFTRVYADPVSPPRWVFTTPLDRAQVFPGPFALPSDVLPLTEIVAVNNQSPQPYQLTVYGPDEKPWPGVLVALYKTTGRVIEQGFTDDRGRLTVLGADTGDTLRALSIDGGVSGEVTVETGANLDLYLRPVSGLVAQAGGEAPRLRIIASPGVDAKEVELLLLLQNFGAGADPGLSVTKPGDPAGFAPITLSYSPTDGAYKGKISFSATQEGTGQVRAVGTTGNTLLRLQSTYRLQYVANDRAHDVYADDGNFSLHLEPGSLPGAAAYFVVMPPGLLPGPLPAGLQPVGDLYDITASGALAVLTKPALLTIHYDATLLGSTAPEQLGLYRWDAYEKTWQEIEGELDEDHKALSASVANLGTYVLAGPAGSPPPPSESIFLPVIIK